MPQLNLAWWILNFLLGWLFLIVLFTILINKNLIPPNSFSLNTSPNIYPTNNWTWN
nr:ATP synthase F0 subunit 8 [Cheiraster sp. SS-2022]